MSSRECQPTLHVVSVSAKYPAEVVSEELQRPPGSSDIGLLAAATKQGVDNNGRSSSRLFWQPVWPADESSWASSRLARLERTAVAKGVLG